MVFEVGFNFYLGSGDIALDMESQFQANQVRIKLLEEQNVQLRLTVDNIKLKRGQAVAGNNIGKSEQLMQHQYSTEDRFREPTM